MQKYSVAVDWTGTTFWHKEGTSILHRENGPAVEYANGTKCWYKNGKRHRLDGPAIEWNGGNNSWHIEGENYTEAEFNKLTQKNISETTYEGKEVIIEGKKYKLTFIDK